MNKAELISTVVESTGLTKKDVEKAINTIFNSIMQSLSKGEKIQIIGFGTFEVKDRKERTGHNPKTGEQIIIPASKMPSFKAGKILKDAVNK